MPKLLVQTTGDFQLLAEGTNEVVRSHALSVVTDTAFIRERERAGQIEVLEEVGSKATNAEWDDTLEQSDGKNDLARKAFASEFARDEKADASFVQPLPETNTTAVKANSSNQAGGLSTDEKPGDVGTKDGPGGERDTNLPKPAHSPKPGAPAARR